MASSEVQERKNQIFSKNIRLGLDEYNTFMIEYMCKGKGGILPTQKERIKEKNKNGNENWKSHYCGRRVH